MLKQQIKQKKGQQGFTLLEILVVVAIMAFLVAMVAPRFAGITGETVGVVCDTNQQRMIAALAAYNERTGNLPSGMVNLVDENHVGVPAVGVPVPVHRPTDTGELLRPDQGRATFFEDFFVRNLFQTHVLNAAEAEELRRMGVGSVHNLNAYNYEGTARVVGTGPGEQVASAARQSAMRNVPVASDLGVLMVGMGAIDANAILTGPGAVTTAGLLERVAGTPHTHWGSPEWLGRIIMGVGPESALIKKGMITAAGLCPGGIGNERVFWNNYNVLLPRLEATTARYDAAMQTYLFAKAEGGAIREFNLREHQQSFMFLTQCPEGHRFATPDGFKRWAIFAGADEANRAAATTGTGSLEGVTF